MFKKNVQVSVFVYHLGFSFRGAMWEQQKVPEWYSIEKYFVPVKTLHDIQLYHVLQKCLFLVISSGILKVRNGQELVFIQMYVIVYCRFRFLCKLREEIETQNQALGFKLVGLSNSSCPCNIILVFIGSFVAWTIFILSLYFLLIKAFIDAIKFHGIYWRSLLKQKLLQPYIYLCYVIWKFQICPNNLLLEHHRVIVGITSFVVHYNSVSLGVPHLIFGGKLVVLSWPVRAQTRVKGFPVSSF